jgi:protein-tyrosine-phosphatase
MVQPRRFVFVCSGNICRSPMAEAIARQRFAQAGLPASFLSMGTLGIYGHPASEFAIAACGERGLDLSEHASQGLSLGLLHQADAVLVMERKHRTLLRERAPELKRVRLLSELDPQGGPPDIDDPIGGTRSDYEVCLARLGRAIDGLIEQVKRGLL